MSTPDDHFKIHSLKMKVKFILFLESIHRMKYGKGYFIDPQKLLLLLPLSHIGPRPITDIIYLIICYHCNCFER